MTTKRYERGELIGQGGMAKVWRGHRVLADGSRQDVAIKVVRDDLRNDPAVKDRFRQEAALTMGFHHENVIKTYDLDRDGGEEIMVMERIDGMCLYTLSQAARIPIPILRYIFVSTAEGLRHIHEHGVIHRDISPGNILLSRAGDLRIVDLGLAKVTGSPTSDGFFKGTVAYASLEALCCAKVTESSDLYSLAAVFYEILAGKPPYGVGQYPQLLNRHRTHVIEPLPPDCPEDLRTILMMLLRPPGKREIASVPELWPRWDAFDDELANRHQVSEFIRRVMDRGGEAKEVADEFSASVVLAGERDTSVRAADDDASDARAPKSDQGTGEREQTVKIDVVDALLDTREQGSKAVHLPPGFEPDEPSRLESRGHSASNGATASTRAKRGWPLVAAIALFAALWIGEKFDSQQPSDDIAVVMQAPELVSSERIAEVDVPLVVERSREHVLVPTLSSQRERDVPKIAEADDQVAPKIAEADDKIAPKMRRRSRQRAAIHRPRPPTRLVEVPVGDVPASFVMGEESQP